MSYAQVTVNNQVYELSSEVVKSASDLSEKLYGPYKAKGKTFTDFSPVVGVLFADIGDVSIKNFFFSRQGVQSAKESQNSVFAGYKTLLDQAITAEKTGDKAKYLSSLSSLESSMEGDFIRYFKLPSRDQLFLFAGFAHLHLRILELLAFEAESSPSLDAKKWTDKAQSTLFKYTQLAKISIIKSYPGFKPYLGEKPGVRYVEQIDSDVDVYRKDGFIKNYYNGKYDDTQLFVRDGADFFGYGEVATINAEKLYSDAHTRLSAYLKADFRSLFPTHYSRFWEVHLLEPLMVSMNSLAGKESQRSSIKMEFCWCPPGSFWMGSPDQKKIVGLTQQFYLGKYEVTWGQWAQVMGKPKRNTYGDQYPVDGITLDEAIKFCEALTKKERALGNIPYNWEYRLPTEAQWEYACRAGTTGAYSFEPTGTFNSSDHFNARGAPQEVGKFKPNNWGLHDMHGNVAEYVRDAGGKPLIGGFDPENIARSGADKNGMEPRGICRGGGYEDSDHVERFQSWYRMTVLSRHKLDSRDWLGNYVDRGLRVALVPLSFGTEKEFGGIPFCWVPESFEMPVSESKENWATAAPELKLSPGFWVAKNECTQSQWTELLESNPSKVKNQNLIVTDGGRPIVKTTVEKYLDKLRPSLSLQDDTQLRIVYSHTMEVPMINLDLSNRSQVATISGIDAERERRANRVLISLPLFLKGRDASQINYNGFRVGIFPDSNR